jgi:acyl dehydratase
MQELAPYRVSAFNTAHDSENKIHDDATAKKFGFGGGLVPGVDVYGYMSHMPATLWGRDWLERGTADCRFFKPVYDGDEAIVTATETAEGLDITVKSRGEVCATGHAALPGSAVVPPTVIDYRAVPQRGERPPADEASLPVNGWLGLAPYPVTPEMAAAYLAASGETATIYTEQRLVHPREILRTCNFVVSRNVALGPWIHTGSRIRHFAAVPIGSTLSVRAHIIGNYEHKGHRFFDIDALVLANEAQPVAHINHIAIYLPRQVAEAA